jgi:Immunity protein 8
MHLTLGTMWSPDLDPSSSGLPADPEDYELPVQVALSEAGKPGKEVFSLTVCSPSALLETESGKFLTHTLVLTPFRWDSLRARLEKLLAQCNSCETWNDVIKRLAPFLRYDDTD